MLGTKKKNHSANEAAGPQKSKGKDLKLKELKPGSRKATYNSRRHVVFPVTTNQSRRAFTPQPSYSLQDYAAALFLQTDQFLSHHHINKHEMRNGSAEPTIELFHTGRPELRHGALSSGDISTELLRDSTSAALYGWLSDSEVEYNHNHLQISDGFSFSTDKNEKNFRSSSPQVNSLHDKPSSKENRHKCRHSPIQQNNQRQFNNDANGFYEETNGYAFAGQIKTRMDTSSHLRNQIHPHLIPSLGQEKQILSPTAPSHPSLQPFTFQESPAHGSQKNGSKPSSAQDCSPAPSVAMTTATVGVASLWVGPLVVLYWCNTWYLSERFVLRDQEKLSAGVCAALGCCVLFLATCLQAKISSAVSGITRSPIRFILSSLYTYVMALACVCQWRGLWALLDIYLHINLKSAAVSGAAAISIMLLIRCYQSVLGAPSVVRPDIRGDNYFTIPTYFRVKADSLSMVWDSLFTVFVVGSLIVCVWRGYWEALDVRLYPSDDTRSGLWCLAVAYSLTLLLSLFQSRLSRLSAYLDSIHWLLKLLLEDCVYIVQSIICVTHWRGFWFLLNKYDTYRPASAVFLHFVAFLLLTATFASQNLLVKGSVKDGGMPDGKGIELNVSYLTELSRCCRSKRQDPESKQ